MAVIPDDARKCWMRGQRLGPSSTGAPSNVFRKEASKRAFARRLQSSQGAGESARRFERTLRIFEKTPKGLSLDVRGGESKDS